MAGRILNRRELRQQADQAGQEGAAVAAPAAAAEAAVKKPKAARVKKPRAKKVPPRMRARWGVFDGGMRQVAVFDYSQRDAADRKLADLRARNKGVHFLQIVKEPMPEPEPAAAAAGN
jgi:hypothetical protein